MSRIPSLSATNIAAHHHLKCDLFLHNAYHYTSSRSPSLNQPSELSKAQFEHGIDWEQRLFAWLDQQGLLLTVASSTLDVIDLKAILDFDDRTHFYVAGLSFWAPMDALRDQYIHTGTQPVNFGVFKPDLVEIKRSEDGTMTWRIIDAKASKHIKVCNVPII